MRSALKLMNMSLCDLACLLSVIIKLAKSRTASNGGAALETASRNMPSSIDKPSVLLI